MVNKRIKYETTNTKGVSFMPQRCISLLLSMLLLFGFIVPVNAADQLSERQVLQTQSLNLGNGHLGQAVLKGRPVDQNSPYMLDLVLIVNIPGQKTAEINLPADFNGGYGNTLSADDFTGDKKDEIVISMATGGSGGVVNYLIYTYRENRWQLIYSPIYPGEIKMTGKYLDGYKAQINLQGISKPVILNLLARKKYLDAASIYKAGKLKEEVIPWMNFDIMQITDYNRDGIQEVRAHYTINGTCNADDIASVWAIWKYENGRWQRHGLTVNLIK